MGQAAAPTVFVLCVGKRQTAEDTYPLEDAKSVVLMSSLSITPSGCGLCEACVSQISLRRVGT